MTSDRLRTVLSLLRWSQRGLAETLSCDDRLVRRWASGDATVPPEVADWLDALAAAHEALPAPAAWRRRPAA